MNAPTIENTGQKAAEGAVKRLVRSRFKPNKMAGMRIEERDEKLLCDLFLHRAMARGQLQALYFSSTVRCNARLRLLFDHGFVRRYYHPAAPYGAQAVYLAGKNAIPIVARRLEMGLAEVAKQVRGGRTPTFIEHTLAIIDVRIAFVNLVKGNPNVEIERWLAEPMCRHEYEIRAAGGTWQKEVFKPDAFIRLYRNDTNEYFNYFIEVDLGHTSSRQFLGKVQMHQRYLESGLFREVYGSEAFQTVVITTGQRRINNLCGVVASRSNCSGPLFRFLTFAQTAPDDLLSFTNTKGMS